MLNKKQLHLKTIQLNQYFCFSNISLPLKQNPITSNNLSPSKEEIIRNKKDISSNLIKKPNKSLANCKFSKKNQPLFANLKNISINQYTVEKFMNPQMYINTESNYQKFPKRQCSIKNTNPFKFYMNSAPPSRVRSEANEASERINIKISQVVKLKQQSFRTSKNKCSTVAESMRELNKKTCSKTRPKSVSMTMIPKKKIEKCVTIEPWQTYDNNFYVTDWS